MINQNQPSTIEHMAKNYKQESILTKLRKLRNCKQESN